MHQYSVPILALLVGAVSGMTYYSMVDTGNKIFVGGHQISIVTEPSPQLNVDGKEVPLSSAGSQENGTNYKLYSDFKDLPGLSIKFYDNNGGYTLYWNENGVVSRFGTMSAEEQKEFNRNMKETFDNVNKQVSQIQQQIGGMMQSLTNMFNQPGWPFVG